MSLDHLIHDSSLSASTRVMDRPRWESAPDQPPASATTPVGWGNGETLTQLAVPAVRHIPGAYGASVILGGADGLDQIGVSAPFVAEIERVQQRLGQGPRVEAATWPTPVATTEHQLSEQEAGVIERALGIMMSRSACSQDRAILRLQKMSEAENQHLATMAQAVIDEALVDPAANYVQMREPHRPFGRSAPTVDPDRAASTSWGSMDGDPQGGDDTIEDL